MVPSGAPLCRFVAYAREMIQWRRVQAMSIIEGARRVLVVGAFSSDLIQALCGAIRERGVSPVCVSTVAEALMILERAPVDAVVVAVGEAFPEGIEVIGRLRGPAPVPIVAVAAPSDGSAIAEALHAGADDFLTEISPDGPQSDAYLAAPPGRAGPAGTREAPTARVRDLTMDFERCQVFVGETPLQITPTEFRLLAALLRSAGRVVSVEALVGEVYTHESRAEADDRDLVKDPLHRLRAKLKPFEGDWPYVVNVRGFGYMLERRERPRSDDDPSG